MIGAMPNDVKPLDDPPAYVDPASGQKYPISEPRWRSDAGAPLMITALPGIGRDRIDTGKRSLWRYAAALPVDVPDPITMGEGFTPLVSRRWRGAPRCSSSSGFRRPAASRTGALPSCSRSSATRV